MKTTKTTKTNKAWWTIAIAPDDSQHILPTLEIALFEKKSEAIKLKKMIESRDDILYFAGENDTGEGIIRYISIGHILDPKCPCQPYYEAKTLVHNIIQ